MLDTPNSKIFDSIHKTRFGRLRYSRFRFWPFGCFFPNFTSC